MQAMFFYDTKLGRIGIAEKDGYICRVIFPEALHNQEYLYQRFSVLETALIKEAGHQLAKYLAGERKTFSLPLAVDSTPFRRKIWQTLREIPYGETVTYREIAEKVGKSKAARAVGLACKCNPLPIIIPCHRVIGSNGKLTGYAGGLALKERLLILEGVRTTLPKGQTLAPPLMQIYKILLSSYGKRNWWPAKTAFEMMVGAILTQNTAWSNVEKAIANFGERLAPQFIDSVSHEELVEIIKPSGYYNQKAVYLKALTAWFKKYDYDIGNVLKIEGQTLRQELLSVKGIGRETADSILTYALEKLYFVVDAYTKRILWRLGYELPSTYDEIRLMIEKSIPKEVYLYNEFHALIVEHAKRFCQKKPLCEDCPLEYLCVKKIVKNS